MESAALANNNLSLHVRLITHSDGDGVTAIVDKA